MASPKEKLNEEMPSKKQRREELEGYTEGCLAFEQKTTATKLQSEEGKAKLEICDKEDIEAVLSFWFDGDLQQNYRQKWFPAQSSETQHAADAEITQHFGKLLQSALEGNLDHWENTPRGAAALIVLLDQFSRHIYRQQGIVGNEREERLAVTGQKSIKLSETLISTEAGRKHLPLPLQIFSLMPLRHMPTKERLKQVMNEIDARAEDHRKEGELLQKFRKTTLRKLQALEDKAEEGAEILEHFAFKAEDSDMPKNKLYKAVEQFVRDHFGQEIQSKAWTPKQTGENDEAEGHLPALAVSLSGGVDSMVLAKILVHARHHYKFQVVGIHIDYANRAESGREADYVEHWCSTQGIIFRKRVINEVTRGLTDRDAYERIARDIRYNTYKDVCKEFGCQGVMFGHHQGDVQENVLSNMMHRSSLLDLAGMKSSSNVNGVVVFRPMLNFNKDAIFEFSHKYGVPYFKDTTPSWSTRGKTRNALIPLLKDIHGEGCLHNLSVLAEESLQMNEMVQQDYFRPFLESVQYTPMGCFFDCMPYRDKSSFFWKECLREVMHSMGMAQLREKAIGVLRKRLAQSKPKDGWLELRRGFPTYLENGSLLIFKEGVLRFLEEDEPWVPNGTEIPLHCETFVGPWMVSIKQLPSEAESSKHEEGNQRQTFTALSKQPAFTTLRQFMGGEFGYYLLAKQQAHQQHDPEFQLECMAHLKPFHPVDKKLRRRLPIVVFKSQCKKGNPETPEENIVDSCFHVSYKFYLRDESL